MLTVEHDTEVLRLIADAVTECVRISQRPALSVASTERALRLARALRHLTILAEFEGIDVGVRYRRLLDMADRLETRAQTA